MYDRPKRAAATDCVLAARLLQHSVIYSFCKSFWCLCLLFEKNAVFFFTLPTCAKLFVTGFVSLIGFNKMPLTFLR